MQHKDKKVLEKQDAVIYLDIDGVLRTKRSNSPHVAASLRQTMPALVGRHGTFDPIAIACLNALTDATCAKLVVCSSHRDNPRIKTLLRGAGVTAAFHPDWRTPDLKHELSNSTFDTRGREVAAHAAANGITRWCWLDDMADCLATQRANLVQVNDTIGLSPHDVDTALEIMGHPPLTPRPVRYRQQIALARDIATAAVPLFDKK